MSTNEDTRFEPNYRADQRRRLAKKLLIVSLGAAIGGMTCVGAMDSPDFVEPDPYFRDPTDDEDE